MQAKILLSLYTAKLCVKISVLQLYGPFWQQSNDFRNFFLE
jgi:hypothetical protein